MKNKMMINGYEVAGRMPVFTAELRQLVRDGIKTETRRVIKPQPREPVVALGFWQNDDTGEWEWQYQSPVEEEPGFVWNELFLLNENGKCPYGKPGDVRVMCEPLHRSLKPVAKYEDSTFVTINRHPVEWKWKRAMLASIFMPTELGRTLVRYTSISVERLQDITDAGAIAEGVQLRGVTRYEGEAREQFAWLWDSVNDKYAWDTNPWVWTIKWGLIQ